jgi:hypothetical protein
VPGERISKVSALPLKQGTIAFIADERLSREKGQLVMRIINAMRPYANIELISGQITEKDLIEKLGQKEYQLVLAPWYRYMAWSRLLWTHANQRTDLRRVFR